MNYQARRRLGCCVYLVHDADEWLLIDIGYEDTLDDIIELIRQMDFPLSSCKYLIATHADVDHIQGLKRAKELLPQAQVVGHPHAAKLLGDGRTDHDLCGNLRAGHFDPSAHGETSTRPIDEGDVLNVGRSRSSTSGTRPATRRPARVPDGKPALSGDNIYRDGCVGNIDAHHGSDIPVFITSLKRIRDSDVEWLLPSHGPIFRKDNDQLQTDDRPPRTSISTWPTSAPAPSTGRCWTSGTKNLPKVSTPIATEPTRIAPGQFKARQRDWCRSRIRKIS